MNSNSPVGIFDSGVGGLSILQKIHQLLPAEDIVYLADSANAPYGPKGDEFILERSREIMEFFLRFPVKAVVVACNTATAAAVKQLREEYGLPIVGMEPAIKPASEKSRSGIIGVLATEGTLASDKFVDLKSRFDGKVEIITQPCPGLVEYIEQGQSDDHGIRQLLEQYIQPLLGKGADTLVLGCTHYTFIESHIREVAGDGVSIVDTDDAVARRLAVVLREEDVLSDTEGSVSFYTSGPIDAQQKVISRYWGEDVKVFPL